MYNVTEHDLVISPNGTIRKIVNLDSFDPLYNEAKRIARLDIKKEEIRLSKLDKSIKVNPYKKRNRICGLTICKDYLLTIDKYDFWKYSFCESKIDNELLYMHKEVYDALEQGYVFDKESKVFVRNEKQ